MIGIEDGPQYVNPSEDMVIRFHCGCEVTFFGASHLRSSRMLACIKHNGMKDTRARDQIVYEARRERDRRLMNQPPMN